MKILILSQYWHPENGVPQRRWAWLTGILTKAGHDVFVVCPPPHYLRKINCRTWLKNRGYKLMTREEEGPHGESILRSGYIPAGNSLIAKATNQLFVALGQVVAIRRWSMIARDAAPDLIIGTVPAIPTAAVAWYASRKLKVPYIIDLRDAWPQLIRYSRNWNDTHRPNGKELGLLPARLLQLALRPVEYVLEKCYAKAAGILVTSERLGEALSSTTLRGRDVPVNLVRNVFPIQSSRPKEDRYMREGLNVLYAGTLGRAQDLENALTAAKIAQENGVKICLRIVGSGAARHALTVRAREMDLDISFEPRRPADDLSDLYDWADTALVHLTDWQPLEMTVPSKTYELMELGVHITGVVSGETADLIEMLGAGSTVAPSDPESLSALWCSLVQDRDLLSVSKKGRDWVAHQRNVVVPGTLLAFISSDGA